MITLLKKLPWFMAALLSLVLFSTTLMYFSMRTDIGFLQVKQNLVHDAAWMTAFYIHITSGMVALITGPFQVLEISRRRFPALHKKLGRLYAYAILVTGSTSGLYMAFFANGGTPASAGFVVMSVLWFMTTFLGVKKAIDGDIRAHRRWMYRSFAMTFSAVTLRISVAALSLLTNMQHLTIVIVTAWSSWLLNLLVTEIYFIIKQHHEKIKHHPVSGSRIWFVVHSR